MYCCTQKANLPVNSKPVKSRLLLSFLKVDALKQRDFKTELFRLEGTGSAGALDCM